MTVDAPAGETLSASRLNGCFQSWLRSLSQSMLFYVCHIVLVEPEERKDSD